MSCGENDGEFNKILGIWGFGIVDFMEMELGGWWGREVRWLAVLLDKGHRVLWRWRGLKVVGVVA